MTNDELHSLVLRGMAATKPKGRSRCVSRRGILVLVAALTLLCLLKPLEIYSGHKSERVWEWTWLAWSWALVQSPGFPSQEGLGSVKTDGTGLYLCLLSTRVPLAGEPEPRSAPHCGAQDEAQVNSKLGAACWQHMPGHQEFCLWARDVRSQVVKGGYSWSEFIACRQKPLLLPDTLAVRMRVDHLAGKSRNRFCLFSMTLTANPQPHLSSPPTKTPAHNSENQRNNITCKIQD